ncbi:MULTISPECIES: hydrogenase maturation peptidase HycI [Vibrio]|uniref:Hydrogenase maturation peptidase HycI n=2 Tax=Vibrio TaxID=662 RepID=A0A7X4RU19_9VIBR|nr:MULTISPECIES: hydrogenase maturation peptidase HycI [Vibrio]MBF9001436.1 hydrogenase maturation peptidase HycI [Vibrio nitrifigilis]MZI92649.1 hydrogenase maturation peptidase HycI [Vibrio eleionomae]
MSQQILLTVGNYMMGDDAAGPLLAKMCKENPLDEWEVLDGGTMPEDVLHLIRKAQPHRIVIVDAADFGEEVGEIRVIEQETSADMFLVSTHSLPLNFLINELKTFVPEVTFLGIQPEMVGFSYPMNPLVKQAVEQIYHALPSWEGDGGYAHC